MPVESAADRAVFLSSDEFGVTATYTPSGGAGVDLDGVYDEPTTQLQVMGEAPALDARATFYCRAADLPPGAESDAGDTLAFTDPVSQSALSFRIATIEPDGQGMALLSLAIEA